MRIRTRLYVAFLLLMGVGFYFLIDRMVGRLRPRYLEAMEEAMVDAATILAAQLSVHATPDAIPVDDLRAALTDAAARRFSARIYQLTKTRLGMRVYVTDRHGRVIFDSAGGRDEGLDYAAWNDVKRTLRGEYGARATRVDPADPRTIILYVAAPVKAGDEIVGAVTVAKPTDSFTLFLDSAQRGVIGAGLLVALAVVALGAVLSLWITRPIERLTRYAKDIRDGLRPPPPSFGGGEIGALGRAFEEMRDALEGKQYVENYVQTLTHEMKSPLSAIRGAAELLQEDMSAPQRAKFLDNILTETARLRGLVDRLLLLSTLENRKELRDVEEVELAALLDEVATSMEPQLTAKGLTLARETTATLTVACERFLVRHAFANLLQNAIDFSPRGGRIAMRLEEHPPGVAVSVCDDGPGVPVYALPRVFERFFSLQRPDSGRKSSGLGLSIVREAALLHGGSATLENRAGGGACATLVLPLRPRPDASGYGG